MKKKRKAKIIKNSKERLRKRQDDSFKTFVKVFICGIILANGIAAAMALLFNRIDFCYGIFLGVAASFFYLWSFAEERKKYLFIVRNQNNQKPPKAFLIRYLVWVVFLGISGYVSIESLMGTFCSLFAVRVTIYVIAYKTKEI